MGTRQAISSAETRRRPPTPETDAPPFEPEVSYIRFGAHATLKHGGDFTPAARQLHEEVERPVEHRRAGQALQRYPPHLRPLPAPLAGRRDRPGLHRPEERHLVLDGPHDEGKSAFARWLCPPARPVRRRRLSPDDKDCSRLALRSLIWEVSELGATTRRADTEALRGFLSHEVSTRSPSPRSASFIGTVNNSAGLFSDPTGNWCSLATTVAAIDWAYQQHHLIPARDRSAWSRGIPSLWTIWPRTRRCRC